MLQLKPTLALFLKCDVRNGLSASFWWDSWTKLGPLLEYVGQRGPSLLRLRRDAKVNEATRQGQWHLPAARSDEVQNLMIHLTTVSPPDNAKGEDVFVWRSPAGSYSANFSSRGTWEQLRIASPPVPWASAIWFKEAIPRASFVLWLVVLRRLPTRDRLLRWGMNVSPLCPLCSMVSESHDHLFFECTFSRSIWQAFAGRVVTNPPAQIMSSINYILQPHDTTSNDRFVILKLLLQLITYAIWRERNARIFTNTTSTPTFIKAMVDQMMRNRLISFSRDSSSSSLLQIYFGCISHPI